MRSSGDVVRNPALEDQSEKYAGAGNLQFFGDALAELGESGDGARGLMAIGFVGSRDIPGVALREAQAILRWGLRPSLWSHVFLVADATAGGSDVSGTKILEVPIFPRTGRFPQPERNGVQEGTLGLYADSELDANVALIGGPHERRRGPSGYGGGRWTTTRTASGSTYGSMLGSWQGFVWTNAQSANPLRDGFPIPSAL
jgi:hypothetical protein